MANLNIVYSGFNKPNGPEGFAAGEILKQIERSQEFPNVDLTAVVCVQTENYGNKTFTFIALRAASRVDEHVLEDAHVLIRDSYQRAYLEDGFVVIPLGERDRVELRGASLSNYLKSKIEQPLSDKKRQLQKLQDELKGAQSAIRSISPKRPVGGAACNLN